MSFGLPRMESMIENCACAFTVRIFFALIIVSRGHDYLKNQLTEIRSKNYVSWIRKELKAISLEKKKKLYSLNVCWLQFLTPKDFTFFYIFFFSLSVNSSWSKHKISSEIFAGSPLYSLSIPFTISGYTVCLLWRRLSVCTCVIERERKRDVMKLIVYLLPVGKCTIDILFLLLLNIIK